MRPLTWAGRACAWAALVMLVASCETTRTVSNSPVSAAGAGGRKVEADTGKRADIRLKLASSYYQNRQFEVAIDEVNQALKIDPALAAAHGLLGLIYMELGDRAQAEVSFKRALDLDRDNPELLNNYGWFLCQTGRERQALDPLLRAASNRRYATPAMALQNAGVCVARVGEFEEAERYLRKSFELDAGNPVTQFNLARLYLRVGRLDRAAFYYDILQRGREPNADVMYLGARIAHAGGDLRTERQLSDELARRFPHSAEAERVQRGLWSD